MVISLLFNLKEKKYTKNTIGKKKIRYSILLNNITK